MKHNSLFHLFNNYLQKFSVQFLYLLVPISFLLNCYTAKGQTSNTDSIINLKLIKHLAGSYKQVKMDNLGNIYTVSINNQIVKRNSNFDSIGVFNDTRRYGNISSIDVTNPLKLLVFYKDFSTIVVLDRFLNVINLIALTKQNLQQVSTIATSYDNKIWLFDEVDNQLKKIDDDGNVMLATADFRLVFNKAFVPEMICDNDGKIYLYASQNGLAVFDYYGALKHKYSIESLRSVQIEQDLIVGLKGHLIETHHLKLLKTVSQKILQSDLLLKDIILQKQLLFALDKSGADIYSY